MSEPHPTTRIGLLRLRPPLDDPRGSHGFERRLRSLPGDAVLMEYDGSGRGGLYAHLAAAARAQRVLLPARWLPAPHALAVGAVSSSRPDAPAEGEPGAFLLAFARSDSALRRLFGEVQPRLDAGSARRVDEPVVLLGVEGDALLRSASAGPIELRRRAEAWIHRLGADRVALAVPPDAGEGHPLVSLARERALPVVVLGDENSTRSEVRGSVPPLLWTDFQLDTEHRLPDDAWIPGLRDLLHRGALLRERVLYDHLPSAWHARADAELRALYAWHVSPLLRRLATLVQTVGSVEGARLEPLAPGLDSVIAFLLGLSLRRPDEASIARTDPVQSARELASFLLEMDRRIVVEIDDQGWPRLMARLLPWAEGGHLALCEETGPRSSVRRFCFSGQPLSARASLRIGRDGLPRTDLGEEDRLALGWFEVELRRTRIGVSAASPSAAPSSSPLPSPARRGQAPQLSLEWTGPASPLSAVAVPSVHVDSPRREKSA